MTLKKHLTLCERNPGNIKLRCYLDNIKTKENKNKMTSVLDEINTFVYSVPPGFFSCLPTGGQGFIDMISKYDDFYSS